MSDVATTMPATHMKTLPNDLAIPFSDIDPFSDEFIMDPYPFQDELREAGPVVWLKKHGVYAMARHSQVHAALTDWATYCSGRGVGIEDFAIANSWRAKSILLEVDPPMHSHPRSVLSRIISPVAMRALRDDWADKAERIIDTLLAKQSFDAVPDLAVAFPLEVFPDAVGFQKDGRDNLLPFGNMIFNSFMQNNDRFRESVKEAEPVISWIFQQCQRKNLSPSGFGSQIWQACDDGVVTEEQAPILIRTFLQAGMDTTVAALGNAIYAFAKFPDQWSALRADASLIRASFDEVLRWETPVQTFFRTTTQGVDVDGSHIEEGRKVLLMMAAANRDPCRFEEPQQFNIRRRTTGHVGFGTGVHGCVGQAIARLEGELIFAALARRIERIELDGSPVRKLNNTLRSFSSIPVRIIPA